MRIEPLTAAQWRVLKALRIAALTESPDAFGPTAADAQARDDAYWMKGATDFGSRPDRVMLILWLDDAPRGLLSAVAGRDRVGYLGAMWVDPRQRGTGAGRELFKRGCDWLLAQGCDPLHLSVTEGNARAISLYETFGFTLTGDSEPLRDGSPLRNLFMERRGKA